MNGSASILRDPGRAAAVYAELGVKPRDGHCERLRGDQTHVFMPVRKSELSAHWINCGCGFPGDPCGLDSNALRRSWLGGAFAGQREYQGKDRKIARLEPESVSVATGHIDDGFGASRVLLGGSPHTG